LVWNNIGNAVLMAQGPNYWPYQLTTIDLVRFADKSAKLAPPAGATQDVKEGFTLFRKNCLGCHTLNGEGGQAAGVELNRPVNVTKYWKKDWLARWIANPQSVRETSRMPQYASESGYQLPEEVRAKQIQQIIEYLEAMAK
jgi:mono/diheme cytochrome c family protein